MANLSSKQKSVVLGPMSTSDETANFEGGTGFKRDDKSELYILGVSLMYGEPTFYESADERAKRWRDLLHTVTKADPDFVRNFLVWLRNKGNIRTASVVGVIEYALAGGPSPRSLIRDVLIRPDEPAEALAYFKYRTGKTPHGGVQRGIADAASRMYSPKNLLKYGGGSRAWTPADVISLTHPKPQTPQQARMFSYVVGSRRLKNAEIGVPKTIAVRNFLSKLPRDEFRRMVLDGDELIHQVMYSWEALTSIYGELDAAFWHYMIPKMGYMALLKNLNNFDRAGISEEFVDKVNGILSGPVNVEKSRQFPYRFATAYDNKLSDNYARSLDKAATLSLRNIPRLKGSTLILVDASGSMGGFGYLGSGGRAGMTPAKSACLLGAAISMACEDVNLVLYDSDSVDITIKPGMSLFRAWTDMTKAIRGGATYTWRALEKHYKGHDRVVILTDMQTQQAFSDPYGSYRFGEPPTRIDLGSAVVYNFNFNGYPGCHSPNGFGSNYIEVGGGLNDAGFKFMQMVESGMRADWPWG